MSEQFVDDRTAARMVKMLRTEFDQSTAVRVALMNMLWALSEMPKDELPEITDDEVEQIMDSLPTNYDAEQQSV